MDLNKKEVLLTIGIPAYNEDVFLEKTIESILKQTYQNFELIICTGGSTDKTVEIATQFEEKDIRVKVINSDRKLNFVENWKQSLDFCTTQYFCWIGAHDILHKNYFYESLKILENQSEIVLVYPLSMGIDKNGFELTPMDSDLKTVGLNYNDRITKIAKNIDYCTAIHGIFRSEILKKLPILRICGFDNLILFACGLFGSFSCTSEIMFYRRVVREESYADSIIRWKNSGMFENTKHSFHIVLVRNIIKYYVLLAPLKSLSHVKLFVRIFNLFCKHFGVEKKAVIKSFIN